MHGNGCVPVYPLAVSAQSAIDKAHAQISFKRSLISSILRRGCIGCARRLAWCVPFARSLDRDPGADRALFGPNAIARIADLRGDSAALGDLLRLRGDYLGTGMVLARAYLDVWIAEAQIRHNDWPAAVQTLDALRDYTDRSEQRYFEFAALAVRAKLEQ